MDRLGNIEAFVVTAELGSFTLAARRLRLSASALSRRVARLEQELGVRLFHRTTRAVRLSDDGTAFFERARAAMRELDEAQAAMADLRDRPAGLLRVEAASIIGRHVLAPVVSRYVAKYPEVQVELLLRDHPSDLASERIDLSLRMGAQPDSGLISRVLGRSRMRVCASPQYLRRKGRPRSPRDLTRHELLGFLVHGQLVPWRLRDGAEVLELMPRGRVAVNSAETLIDLVVGGAGLAWLCDFMATRPMAQDQLVEVLSDCAVEEVPIQLLSLPNRPAAPKIRTFIDLVSRELGRSGITASRS